MARIHPAASTKPAGEMHAWTVGLTPALVSYPGYSGPKVVLPLLPGHLFLDPDPFLLSFLDAEAQAQGLKLDQCGQEALGFPSHDL